MSLALKDEGILKDIQENILFERIQVGFQRMKKEDPKGYKDITKRQEKASQRLNLTLSKEQKELFNTYADIHAELDAFSEEAAYMQGLRDGAELRRILE